MIDQFVGFCLHRRIAIIVLAVLLAGFGVYAWETLSVEAYPELGDVAAQVTTQIPGLAAEEVEQLITVPLEREINGTPGLLLMRSSSTFGLSLITVLFRDGYEDYWVRQRLIERINQAVLPPGATPSLDPVAGPGRRDLSLYAGIATRKNLQELSEIQRWTVIPALKSVPGVVDDTNFGGFTTEYQLDLDPKQLTHYGLGITDVINAINNNNTNAGGGRVSRGDQSYVIRGVGLIHTLDEHRLHRGHPGERRAGAGARPRPHHAQPSGARRHSRQGQQPRHDRGHRADAQVPEPVADPARRPCQGRGAQRKAGARAM